MKKIFVFTIALLLAMSSLSFASVGYKKDGEDKGNITSIDFKRGYTTFDGSTLSFYSNGYAGGVTNNVSTESSLTSAALAYGFVRKLAADGTAAQNTVGLADGTPGQMLTIQLVLKGTNSYIIDKTCAATHTTTTGWTTLTFDTSLDSITLLYLDDVTGWLVVGNNGVTVA